MEIFGNLDIDNFFKEFWCKGKERDGAVDRKSNCIKNNSVFVVAAAAVFKMDEITAYL